MSISVFSAPLYLSEEVDYILNNRNDLENKVRKALQDIKNDLDCIHKMTYILDKWESGNLSDKELLAGYNLYCSQRGRVRFRDDLLTGELI